MNQYTKKTRELAKQGWYRRNDVNNALGVFLPKNWAKIVEDAGIETKPMMGGITGPWVHIGDIPRMRRLFVPPEGWIKLTKGNGDNYLFAWADSQGIPQERRHDIVYVPDVYEDAINKKRKAVQAHRDMIQAVQRGHNAMGFFGQ